MTTRKSGYHFPLIDRPMTDIEVFRAAGELRADRGTPEQARELMAQFVAAAYNSECPPRELVTFVRDALADYLNGSTLEAAFRVKRGRRGRPTVEVRARIDIAKSMLRLYVIHGEALEDAAIAVAETRNSNRTKAWEAFRECKAKALQEMSARDDGPPELNEAFPLHRERIMRLFGTALA
jgi:hypothetical protein